LIERSVCAIRIPMRRHTSPNHRFRALLEETGLTEAETARRVNRIGAEAGVALRYQRASVSQWLSGTRPRPPVPDYLAELFTRALGRPVTAADLGFAASEAIAAELPDDLGDALHQACRPVLRRPDASVFSLGALDVPPWPPAVPHVARPAPPGRRTRVSHAEVASAEAMLRMFSELDACAGGGRVRDALTRYLRVTVTPWLLTDASPAVHKRLLVVAAELTYLCGFVHFDDEMYGAAQRYYLTSMRIAAEVGEPVGYALALRGLSVLAAHLGHHAEAADLADAAARAAVGRVPAKTRAFLLGQLAVTQAARGDRHRSLHTFAAAERQLSRSDPGPTAVGACNPASLAHQEAAILTWLGDRDKPIQALATSVRNRPDVERRSRAITLARLAELQFGSGRIDQACSTWHRFLDDLPHLTSRRADTAARALRALARPHRNLPAVRAVLLRAA
jgi:hypothetical protein